MLKSKPEAPLQPHHFYCALHPWLKPWKPWYGALACGATRSKRICLPLGILMPNQTGSSAERANCSHLGAVTLGSRRSDSLKQLAAVIVPCWMPYWTPVCRQIASSLHQDKGSKSPWGSAGRSVQRPQCLDTCTERLLSASSSTKNSSRS
jgi:hypothetical protein